MAPAAAHPAFRYTYPLPSALMSQLPEHTPTVATFRGGHPENVFYGSIAVVDKRGKLLAHAGDMRTPMFTRSALKPFQAMPLIAGFADRFDLSDADVALLCASHNGEAAHASRAASLLSRAGRNEADLLCGTHLPYYYTTNHITPPEPPNYNRLNHNCSGKHSGMLMLGAALGVSHQHYTNIEHPVQQAIVQSVCHFCGLQPSQLVVGIDGCSVPNFAVPLPNLARAFAQLTSAQADGVYGTAPARIFQAMSQHPAMVSGLGRNDLAITRAGAGDWVSKVGADGVQTITSASRGASIVGKIADGNLDMLMVMMMSALEQMGWMNDTARTALRAYVPGPLKNVAKLDVGHTQAVFQLN
jgi:L-asparaginase II